jgi:dTDP-4-amino-4,6-dideoxygalactose transaminase
MRTPFADLTAQYQSVRTAVDAAIKDVMNGGLFVRGAPVAHFEQAWAEAVGCRHAIGVGNGTDALFAILKCLGIGPGDEVITPAWGWISSASTLSLAGATPVFADVDAGTFALAAERVAAKITPRTKAVVVVHLYGQVADMPRLQHVANRHGLPLIEDCAQAHLSAAHGATAGQFGVGAAFSFYPTKNLGAMGDAGAVVTNDAQLAMRVRRFANHGGLTKDEHLFEGINSRLDTLQAAVLSAKLSYLPAWNQRRRAHAARYVARLASLPQLQLPRITEGHTFHLFVVRCAARNELLAFLRQHGVEAHVHYPRAIPFEPAYAGLGFQPADFPVAAALQHEVLSLPVYPELSDQQIDYVCDCIERFYER